MAAHDSHQAVLVSLKNHPLGNGANENFSVPSNYRIPPARIYVINHSRTRKWKRIIIPVSATRGAEDALMYDDDQPKGKRLRDIYNADLMVKQVEKGRDMNVYKTELKPIVWKVSVPGGQFAFVPPSHPDNPDRPIMVEVPEGTWDLHFGNYDRMKGYPGIGPRFITSPDGTQIPNPLEKFSASVKGQEESALAVRWRGRHNPFFCYTDDGETTQRDNQFGILEMVRITQRSVTETIDKEYLSALDLFESN